ncbi:MAG TPA: C-terminal helicase domain-containing protein [Chryseosolibacter sp.]
MSLQLCTDNSTSFQLLKVMPQPFLVHRLSPTAQQDLHSPGAFEQFVYQVPEAMKTALTVELLSNEDVDNVIVYVKTNFAADTLADTLNRAGITAESFHGNKSQRTRRSSAANFENKRTRTLVVTESAASDIPTTSVRMVVNYNIPVSAETYIKRLNDHRHQQGWQGKAISLCDPCEQGHLTNINRVLAGEIQLLKRSVA